MPFCVCAAVFGSLTSLIFPSSLSLCLSLSACLPPSEGAELKPSTGRGVCGSLFLHAQLLACQVAKGLSAVPNKTSALFCPSQIFGDVENCAVSGTFYVQNHILVNTLLDFCLQLNGNTCVKSAYLVNVHLNLWDFFFTLRATECSDCVWCDFVLSSVHWYFMDICVCLVSYDSMICI